MIKTDVEMCDYDKWYNGVIFIVIGMSAFLSIVFLKSATRLERQEENLKATLVLQQLSKN